VPGTQRKQPVRLPMRLLVSIAAIAVIAAPSVAQTAGTLVADLRKGVPCASASAARTAMEANIGKATAVAADIDAALTTINTDGSICSALRDAARDIKTARAGGTTLAASAATAAPTITADIAATSREAVAAALAEGERRAASLKFEVGPPPPNLTKGRISGP
jgi:hypothetical protein